MYGHAHHLLPLDANLADVEAEAKLKPDAAGLVPYLGRAPQGPGGAVEDGEEPVACGVDLPEIGVPDPGWLYEQLAPHAGELAITGVGADCGGAVDSLLAGLAWRLRRTAEAAEHAQADLALGTKVGSAIWIKRTKELIGRISDPPGP